jgi:hypothetical protein
MWKGWSNSTLVTDCFWLVMWIWVLEDVVAGAGEGAALGEDVDVGIDGDDLGQEDVFVLLEAALVVGLDVAAVLGGEVLVEDVGVVEVPAAAGDSEEQEERGGGNEAVHALAGETQARGPGVVRTAASEGDGDDREDAGDGEPVGDGPEGTKCP